MAVDAFIYFVTNPNDKSYRPLGETQDEYFGKTQGRSAFEIKEFSFDVENPATIGSATTGAGAGKVKFNEFTIKKNTDSASHMFFRNCCAGVHYRGAIIAIRKAGADAEGAGKPFLEYSFGLCFATKVEWSGPGDEGPEESITFAYGALGIRYWHQAKDGSFDKKKIVGWSQLTNKEIAEGDIVFDVTGG